MNDLNIYPKNSETTLAFQRMLFSQDPEPIVEMNEETARDITIIWDSIIHSAQYWRGEQEIHIPEMPMDRKIFWGTFSQGNLAPLPLADLFIQRVSGNGKVAIDLGCGNSPAIPKLLAKGWRVIAVDYSPMVMNILSSKYKKEIERGQLELVEEEITNFNPVEPIDLVIAADVFPYINPAKFRETWMKIHANFLKEGGVFIGTFFRSINSLPRNNLIKEMGAWLIPDRRMVRSLLINSGYFVENCAFRNDGGAEQPAVIQFRVVKI